MNTPLTLSEVGKLVDELSVEDVMTDERIQEFISRVEEMGKEILQQKENVGKYVEDASDFMCSAVIAECLSGDDVEDKMVAMMMLQSPGTFKLILGYSFIYAVGLCAIEELR